MEQIKKLEQALSDNTWLSHKIGDGYDMINVGGKIDSGWKISYYPLFGTYKLINEVNIWCDFNEPRALIEKKITGGGTDFREVPLRYLIKHKN